MFGFEIRRRLLTDNWKVCMEQQMKQWKYYRQANNASLKYINEYNYFPY